MTNPAGGLPARRIDQQTAPAAAGLLPAPQNLAFARTVIVFGPAGTVVGVFIYQPGTTPGPGNPPVISLLGYPGSPATDPYGNAVQGGVVSYGTGAFAGAFAQLIQGQLVLADTGGATSGAQAVIVGGTRYLELQRGTAGGVYLLAPSVPTDVNTWVANTPGVPGTPEPWHTIALNAGFAALAGFAAPRYRYEAIGTAGQVRLAGALSLTANQAVGAAFATMPAAYQPSFSQYFLTGNSLVGGVGSEVESVRVINATGGGFLELGSNGNAGNYVLLDGITYELD